MTPSKIVADASQVWDNEIANIAQNQTLSIDNTTRQTLTEIGDALNSVAQDFDGVYQSNSSSS